MMKTVNDIPQGELKGKRVLVRTDLNLPLDAAGEVSNLFRAKRGWQTIQYLSEKGAKVILLSHIGNDIEDSMAPVARAMKKHFSLFYVPDIVGNAAREAIAEMKEGDVLLLENIRRDPREKKNDESLAKELASLADIYVNDSFAVDHRVHASLVSVPKFMPSYAGLLVEEELEVLRKARTPTRPSFAILGGAKFETKAPLIKLLLQTYDHVFITGALANDVFKARGLPVGRSRISAQLPEKEVLSHPGFLAPVDVVVEREDGQAQTKKPEQVEDGDKIVDIGPDSLALIAPYIEKANFILWNGPTGLYEDGYTSWTHAVAALTAKRFADGASVVIGGGDTIAAIEGAGIKQENLGFLSTGGGAMLEYLLKGTLPAIEALG
ncbi:MAG: phosphoglycerate kinase [Parcubacteria group bacterium Gr01-1014_8]|nr:MAG: phosphoglycerate kinase [Parcubacteria group bacterium Gr01-1014_8]